MNAYMLTMFWLHILGIVMRLAKMSSDSYPEEKTVSLGTAVSEAVIGIAFAVWSGIVLWI